MKELIIGYITAVINNYTRTIDTFKQYNAANGSIRRFETIREELNDLLDFVEDIPEETKEPYTIIFRTDSEEEVNILRKRIRELEDSCENMCEIERNLRNKIMLLEADNQRLNKCIGGSR